METIQQEIEIMSNLHRPQLIEYFGSYVVGSALWIVMEYLEAGNKFKER
jgi:serine/threonine protein kinase